MQIAAGSLFHPSPGIPGEGIRGLREWLAVTALLVVLLLAQIFATRSSNLFTHSMWLDEILTWTIANDPSFAHALAAVKGGVETNPPTMYLILWPIAKLCGGLDEIGLRVFAFASLLIALLGIYALCRSCFNRLASLVGVLIVAAHPLVVQHMFEARFYGPWLAATVWHALLVMRLGDDDARRSTWLVIAACVVAILAATMQYFGVIAVALISVTSLVVARRSSRARSAQLLPPAVAIIASLACVPFIFSQRAGLHVRTWIDPTSLAGVKDVIVSLYAPLSLLLVVFAVWIWRVVRGPRGAVDRVEGESRDLRPLAPITSLLVFPIIIVAFSYIVQPAVKERYLIIAVAPLACLGAYAASRSPAWLAGCVLLGLLVVGSAEVWARSRAVRGLDRDIHAMIDEIERFAPPGTPLVFKRRVEMYPLTRVRPDLLDRAGLLDFDVARDPGVRAFSIYERDMARKFAAFYDRYQPVNLPDINPGSVLVVPPDPLERAEIGSLVAPHRVESSGTWTAQVKAN